MVSGQYPETARVHRYRGMQAELGREVCHRAVGRETAAEGGAPARPGQVIIETGHEIVEAAQEGRAAGHVIEPHHFDLEEQGDRIVLGIPPQQGINSAEEITRRGVPAPPEVVGQVPEPPEAFGQVGGRSCQHCRCSLMSIGIFGPGSQYITFSTDRQGFRPPVNSPR